MKHFPMKHEYKLGEYLAYVRKGKQAKQVHNTLQKPLSSHAPGLATLLTSGTIVWQVAGAEFEYLSPRIYDSWEV